MSEALSRDSALSSWFCSEARRSSASNQRVNMARLTGTSMAMATISQMRRVRPLRKTELYGLPLIPFLFMRCIRATRDGLPW